MNACTVNVRELIAWGFDDYPYRPALMNNDPHTVAQRIVSQRMPFEPFDPRLSIETSIISDQLASHVTRQDLQVEMAGITHSLGVVDLRLLLAFQRRLYFDSAVSRMASPVQNDWAGLMALCLGPTMQGGYQVQQHSAKSLTLLSSNPNVHVRLASHLDPAISISAGSPFVEVASYRGRWFLRDGYHRAYALMQAGVFQVPAVVAEVNTLQQLGADQAQFFDEAILLSSRPPLLTDFLKDSLNIDYCRTPLLKRIRVTIEESYEPISVSGE